MPKKILFHDDARKALKVGIDAVAEAVSVTIGPRGQNVMLDRGFGRPTITNDGVSIAKEINFKDKFHNMGADIIKEVAEKTNDIAGDGTTTATVLTHALITEGLKKISLGGSGVLVRRGMEEALIDATAVLKKIAKPIKNKQEIEQVATISAESEELGSIIADTIDKVGKDGVVTVEESQVFGISSDVVEGLQFDKGYISHYMVTDTERMEAIHNDALILITDKKISIIKDILPLLEKLAQTGRKDLVIICEDLDGEALATIVLNKLRGALNVLAIKAPGYGDRKRDMLDDIAVTTGATVVSEERGLKLDSVGLEVLGRAHKVIAKKDTTVIVGGKGKKKDIDARIASLRVLLENTPSKFDAEKVEERIAKLSGGVAVIRVGAATETEMKYLKLKIEDAVNATKAAIEEGIVPGGGSALAIVAGELGAKNTAKKSRGEEHETGYRIVVGALTEPLRRIAVNAGQSDGSVKVFEVQQAGGTAGYDAVNDVVVPDMFKAGIVDPVKVTRTALLHAVSSAAIFLTTEVAVAEESEDKTGHGHSHDHDH
jgi:chaperonin GroEL